MRKKVHDGCYYVLDNAVDILENYENEAAAVFLDDAWARPKRADQFGVEYQTHPFDNQQDIGPRVDTSTTTQDIIDSAYTALEDGGWLIADADDWLLPRLIDYLQREWGDVAKTYTGGGYRKVGGVTYLKSDGTPDQSTAGMYLSTGGYPVVFAHKGETDRQTTVSSRQLAERERHDYNWGSVKPISPYKEWIEGLLSPDDLILVPCAGTAPTALAAEKAFGEGARYVCIDNERGAYDAFKTRRRTELLTPEQDLK